MSLTTVQRNHTCGYWQIIGSENVIVSEIFTILFLTLIVSLMSNIFLLYRPNGTFRTPLGPTRFVLTLYFRTNTTLLTLNLPRESMAHGRVAV